MSEIKITAATIVDLADMAQAVGASRVQWGVIRDLVATGETWALRVDDDLIGLAGFVAIGPDQAEAWFHFRPLASAHMLGVVRAIRLTMDASPYRAIVTLCTSRAGSRIARAAGFAFAEHSDFGEVWAYGSTGRGPSETADGEPATNVAGGIGKPASGNRPGEL